ncbi:hypothetical protein HK101_008487 [Irineochytrium annulatum]|nr:hypothetical protein HK101_008487 [Irineochytrium annulatum]
MPSLNLDVMRCVVQAVDPQTPLGKLSLYACLQSSTPLLECAAPLLWSTAIIDNVGTIDGNSNWRIPTEVLASPPASFRSSDRRPRDAAWRWSLYLRSIRRISIDLFAPSPRLEPELLAPHLGHIDFIHVAGLTFQMRQAVPPPCVEDQAFIEHWLQWAVDTLNRTVRAPELSIFNIKAEETLRLFGCRKIQRLRINNDLHVSVEQTLAMCPRLEMLDIACSSVQMDWEGVNKSESLRELRWRTWSLNYAVAEEAWPLVMSSFSSRCRGWNGSIEYESQLRRLTQLMSRTRSTLRDLDVGFQWAPPRTFPSCVANMTNLRNLTVEFDYDMFMTSQWEPLLGALSGMLNLEALSLLYARKHPTGCMDERITSLPHLKRLHTKGIQRVVLPVVLPKLEHLSATSGELVVSQTLLSSGGMRALEELTLERVRVVSVDGNDLEDSFDAMLMKVSLTPYLRKVWIKPSTRAPKRLHDWRKGFNTRCVL